MRSGCTKARQTRGRNYDITYWWQTINRVFIVEHTVIERQAEESSKTFKKLRYKHSTVESDINRLEDHGLDRCLDKGLKAFKRYCALGVMAAMKRIVVLCYKISYQFSILKMVSVLSYEISRSSYAPLGIVVLYSRSGALAS
ncbi:MAG: hypothetical protein HRF42_02200 [Candidatus Brocadia sp.]|jgi:hypothetical protein